MSAPKNPGNRTNAAGIRPWRAYEFVQAGLWLLLFGFGMSFHAREGFRIDLCLGFASALALGVVAPLSWFGADLVTRARGMLLPLSLFWHGTSESWWSFLSVGLVLSLDLVDGWIARRTKATESGAWADMESDQLAITMLATSAVVLSLVGGWVLLLPAWRHAYVLFGFLARWPVHDPKPQKAGNRRGKLICFAVVLLCTLILAPGVSPVLAGVLSGTALLLLTYSFGADIVGFLRPTR